MSVHSQSTGAGQTLSVEKPANLARSGDLEVRLAASEDEIIAAQALRYRIFYDEMKAVPSAGVARTGRDVDRFDAAADPLLVIDTRGTQADRDSRRSSDLRDRRCDERGDEHTGNERRDDQAADSDQAAWRAVRVHRRRADIAG